LDYIKIGLFKIAEKILEVIYKLDLPVKIKIYLVQHIAILELVYRDLVLLVYKKTFIEVKKKINSYLRKLLVIKKWIIKCGIKYYRKAIKKLHRN